MTFPAELVPDGHLAAPHHLYIGGVLALLVVWVVADDFPQREPVATTVGLLVALGAFALAWRWYPVTGAALTLAGLCGALCAVLWPGGVWAAYGWRARLLAVLGVLAALDDAVSHAFGVPTPLDFLWSVVYPFVP